MSLLKGYSAAQDTENTVEVLRLILKHNMVLPTTFVRDICWRAEIREDIRCVCVCVCVWCGFLLTKSVCRSSDHCRNTLLGQFARSRTRDDSESQSTTPDKDSNTEQDST